MTEIRFQLADELVEQAERFGLLTNERIARLLSAEMERQAVRRETEQTLATLQAAVHAEFGDMTEDDFLKLVQDEVDSVRETLYTNFGDEEKTSSL